MIFVFGSNLQGRHGKGAALFAKKNHGAEEGVGQGRTGDSYAIPTRCLWRDSNGKAFLTTLPLTNIELYVQEFIKYAKKNKDLTFLVTRVGCGLAGYTDSEIGPMFKDAPPNCQLPEEWL